MRQIIFLLVFILSLTCVFSESYIGDNDFYAGEGYLNHGEAAELTSSIALTNLSHPPLTGDVTGDGETNIVIVDDNQYLKVYKDTTLTGVSNQIISIGADRGESSTNKFTEGVSDMIIFDWGNDGKDDIFIMHEDNMSVYTYNDTTGIFDKNFDVEYTHYSGQIGCTNEYDNGTEDISACMIVSYARSYSGVSYLSFTGFSENNLNTTPFDYKVPDPKTNYDYPHSTYTHSHGSNIAYSQGTWYFSALGIIPGGTFGDDYGYLVMGKMSPEQTDNTEGINESNIELELHGNGRVRDWLDPNYELPKKDFPVQGVLWADIDGWETTGLEGVYSYKSNDGKYKLRFINSELETVSEVGVIDPGEGSVITNPVILKGTDSSLDACGGGFMDTGGMTILCGSFGVAGGAYELFYDEFNDNVVNITAYPWSDMIYSTEQLRREIEGENDIIKNEFVTPYGILIPNDCSGLTNNCALNPMFTPSETSSTLEPDSHLQVWDFDDTGRTDMLKSNSNLLAYYDDGFTNQPGQVDQVRIDPCLEQPWQLNTSVMVHVTVADDFDRVSSKVTLYEGTDHEQVSNWTSYTQAGNEISHSFIANHTTSSGTIKVEARDEVTPGEIDTEEISFSVVASGGIEFGECISTIDANTTYDEEDEERAEGEPGTTQDNTIKDGLDTAAGEFGVPVIVLFILAWLIIIYQVWKSPITETQPTLSFGIIILVSVGMLMLGVKIGVISVGFIITMSILALIPVGLMIGKKITGGY